MNINKMIKETKNNGNKVWIFSDLHILKRDSSSPRTYRNEKTYMKFREEMKNVNQDDMVIFLGDVTDDTIRVHRTMKFIQEEFFPKMKYPRLKKVWIRGNNDMVSDTHLKVEGWEVCYAACAYYHDIIFVFTHTSIDVSGYADCVINVHGHMHRNDGSTMFYYDEPERCINVAPLLSKGYSLELDDIGSMISSRVWESNLHEPGEEKPGMSRFIKQMAIAEADEYLNDWREINL